MLQEAEKEETATRVDNVAEQGRDEEEKEEKEEGVVEL